MISLAREAAIPRHRRADRSTEALAPATAARRSATPGTLRHARSTTDDQETLAAVEALAGEIEGKDARRLAAYCAECLADLRAGIQYESPLRKLFKRQ